MLPTAVRSGEKACGATATISTASSCLGVSSTRVAVGAATFASSFCAPPLQAVSPAAATISAAAAARL